jgi:predicted nucleic acid-binding protein
VAFLIDAGILIEAERGRLYLGPQDVRRPEETSFLSITTAGELLHGVDRATQPKVREFTRIPGLVVENWGLPAR